jgi:hypothetical protein
LGQEVHVSMRVTADIREKVGKEGRRANDVDWHPNATYVWQIGGTAVAFI